MGFANDLPVNHRINRRRYKPGKRITLAQLRVKVRQLNRKLVTPGPPPTS